ncbi:hypothetical protein PVAP13_2NG006902 [Panicum virgatum]|uniref:Uncharacterized protein n=1 Tax=Panicum virgatum TaxID=38727 RepID=A0A8T0V9E5_PANVG|nr:hypothetical protein PVAP13_2NG006902 [Panicum virgatum]
MSPSLGLSYGGSWHLQRSARQARCSTRSGLPIRPCTRRGESSPSTSATPTPASRGQTQTMFQLCIPSWVAFADDGAVLVGEDARNHAAVNPQAAVSGFKRLLGKRLTRVLEREFGQRVKENLSYKIDVDKDVWPHIQVTTSDGEVRLLGVEKLTAMVVAKLKETAEAYLGHRVEAAIFTLPLEFSDEASRGAAFFTGRLAGFEAMRVLSEPTAAANAHGVDERLRDEGSVVVLHVGGGTAEASVLTLVDGAYEALGLEHDPFFGGQDFDRRITDHFVGLVRSKHGKDIGGDGAALDKLRTACERAKKTLSHQDHARVTVESLVDGVDLAEPLTRAEFEELNHDLFLKVVELVDKVVSQARDYYMDSKLVIDEVVLIGGSTMIPKLRELVRDYFGGTKELSTRIKPDEVVTIGAVEYSKWIYSKRRSALLARRELS